MKSEYALIALSVTGLLLVVLLLRQSAMESELALARSELASAKKVQHMDRSTESPVPVDVTADTDSRRIGVPVESAPPSREERVADLENTVNAQARLIEEMQAKLDDAAAKTAKQNAPSWGEIQATGSPDTMTAGDQRSAWAPLQQDGGAEWLELSFEKSVPISQLVVRETFNPGAVVKITATTETGIEVTVWEGEDPGKGQQMSDSLFPAANNVTTSRVRVHLDTKRVPGWNEIDAVQMIGRDGTRQWAKSASASSSYGGRLQTYDTFRLINPGRTLR